MSTESNNLMKNAVAPDPAADARLVTLMGELDGYAKAMAPGIPMSSEEGAKWQKRLNDRIWKLLRLNGPDFWTGWEALLKFALREREGVFHNQYPFRFPEYLALSPKDTQNFHRLILLIQRTCNPKTRAAQLAQLNMITLTKDLPGSVGDKLRAFYEV